jgi:carnitine-CoA ligase
VETGLRAHPAVAVHAVFSDSGKDDVEATIVLKEDAANDEQLRDESLSLRNLPNSSVN